MRILTLELLTAAALLSATPAQASEPLDVSSVPKLYPVPTRDLLNVVARGDPHGYSIRFVQVNGRLVRKTHFPPSDGQYHTLTLSTVGLPSGLYALVYASDLPGGAVAVRRFLILR
jgi:hypothetical protein